MTLPIEDLATLAARQYESAGLHCGACRPYHAMWPLMRVTRQVGGVEADEPFLGPLLAELIGPTPRHIVLAGSADSGVLAMVYRASLAGGARHRFTVVDRCETPFDACRHFASHNAIELHTLADDLREFPSGLQADLIVGHSVLPFVPLADRAKALASLRGGLARGGRVVLSARIAPPDRDRDAHHRDPGQWARTLFENVRAGMQQRGWTLPCTDEELESLARLWVARDQFHVAPYEQAEGLRRDLEAAGFEVERLMPIGHGIEFMKDGSIAAKGKQGIVAVAAAKP
jgi:hypothetical protein